MGNLTEIIRREAEKRYPRIDFRAAKEFINGASWMAEYLPKVLEWASDSGWRRFTAMGKKVWCDESEYEWMGEEDRLITTSQLIERYFEHIKSKE